MGLGVESSGGSGGLPWVFGSSLGELGWCSNGEDSSTGVRAGSRGSCHTWGDTAPFVPLSLRAFKGEGEIRIEAHVRALHARGPLIQYWWDGEGFPVGVGNDERGEKKGVMATNEVVYGRDAVDSSRGLGMGGGGVRVIRVPK